MCAYPTDQTGQTARWSHLQAIIDVLQGTTADRIQIIQYNNSSYYAGDFRNLDTTNSYGLRVRDASNNNLLLVYKNNLALGASAATDALAINCNISGKVYIGDSANADMTAGLTINQGANDDQILAFKSSDVAHGITTVVETDTFGSFSKLAGANGGMLMRGFLDTGTNGIQLQSFSPTDDTTKSTAGTGAIELRVYKTDGTGHQDAGTDANLVVIGNRSTTRLIVDAEGHIHSIGASATDMLGNGKWFLNDTANAGMTLGLTINQGASDNEILAFKSSDVAHGVTEVAETDTYGFFAKLEAVAGGLRVSGLTDTDATLKYALYLQGIHGVAADTTKSTAGRGIIQLNTWVKSGTGAGAPAADSNLVAIDAGGTTRYIFDVEGSFHADVESTTFDAYDDVQLLEALDTEFNRRQGNAVGHEFGTWLQEHKAILQREKIVNFYDPDGPRAMVNMTRLAMLHTGAIRQVGSKIDALAERLALAESRLAALPEGGATA